MYSFIQVFLPLSRLAQFFLPPGRLPELSQPIKASSCSVFIITSPGQYLFMLWYAAAYLLWPSLIFLICPYLSEGRWRLEGHKCKVCPVKSIDVETKFLMKSHALLNVYSMEFCFYGFKIIIQTTQNVAIVGSVDIFFSTIKKQQL